MDVIIISVVVNSFSKSFELHLDGKGKTGDLAVTLTGIEVNMSRFPKRNQSRHTSTANGKAALCVWIITSSTPWPMVRPRVWIITRNCAWPGVVAVYSALEFL
jgi:hypothetical protein